MGSQCRSHEQDHYYISRLWTTLPLLVEFDVIDLGED